MAYKMVRLFDGYQLNHPCETFQGWLTTSNGETGYYGYRRDAKKDSRKARRANDKAACRDY